MATLYGTNLADILRGPNGQINYIYGYDGHDSLYGGDRTDYLYGGNGNDFLSGMAGNDYLYGGEGADSFDGGAGIDYYDGGTGIDLAYFGWNTQTTGASVDLTLNRVNNDGFGNVESIYNIENLSGSRFDDYFVGSAVANELLGGGGNDTLFGRGGHDILWGDEGDDRLFGEDGDDTLIGGLGQDQLYGGSGNDLLRGFEGDDLLRGGSGVDDHDGGAGHDRVSLYERDATQAAHVDLRLQKVLNDGFGNYEYLTSIEGIGQGTQFADTFHGNDAFNTILAGRGDFVYAHGGDDQVSIYGAPATLDGGAGTDTLGFGRDMLVADGDGDGLADSIYAELGVSANLATGQILNDGFGNSGTFSGFENLDGSELADSLTGDAGANVLKGLAGADTLDGGEGADRLEGGDGADTLLGGGGDDILLGGEGRDRLSGGSGNDILNGGLDGDTLTGGAGQDRFVFSPDKSAAPSGSPPLLGIITDFKGEDLIDLSGIDARIGTKIDDAFTFIGNRAFTGQAGQLATIVNGKTTYVVGDVNGDGAADFYIQLNGVHSLTSSDFWL